MRSSVWLLGLVIGCVKPVDPADTVADEADATGTEAGSETTSDDESDSSPKADMPTGCVACDEQCAGQIDECGNPFEGYCNFAAEECECYPAPGCPPCDPSQCEWYEQCYEGRGSCNYCVGDFVEAWDPEAPCEIALLPGFPDFLADYLQIQMAGESVWKADDCTDPAAWTWKTPWTLIELCPDACTTFESVGQADLSWSFPCE
jgi:hypothetical protein